jgi:FHS family Na+ dependent glucose MFS transporter 1
VYWLCFTVVGLAMAMAGPSLTHLRDQVGAGVAAGGILLAALSTGYIVASLLVGRRLDHGAGHRTILVAGIVAAAAVLALEVAGSLLALALALAVLGACGGVVDVACNTLLVWNEPAGQAASALNALHLCFGLGAIAAPLVVAASLELTGGLVLLAATIAGIVAIAGALFRTRPAPLPRRTGAPDGGAGGDAGGRGPVLVAAAVFLALYVGAEGTFASWVATYGEDLELGVDQGPALLTATFWVGFSLGRVTAVVVTRARSVEPLLLGACVAATVVAALLWIGDSRAAATWVLTALLGFLLGPQYATMLAATDHRVGLDGRSTSLLVGMAGVGGLLGPLLTAVILDAWGVDLLPAVVAVGIGAATVAAFAAIAAPATQHGTRPGTIAAENQGDP